jgi:glyoxylase-like metal-dependent hydrolase (beta-lactamase superfamily II)
MILRPYFLGCLSHASYLIGDESSGAAAVVDPQRDVEGYLADARELGLTIRHVFLTHFHADFVAGHLELRDITGASIHLGARAEAEYPFHAMRDGDTLALGDSVRLQVLETPGHTPEGISILVFDVARDASRPHAVLTGDTLFIGDVGRPDLMASVGMTAESLAGMLYDSLRGKLMALPDETLVYPAHGAGSMCGKNLSTDTVSTIGVQRRYNYALQPMSREAFVRIVTADQPEAPAYFSHDAMLNRSERPGLPETLRQVLRPLPLDEVLRLAAAGAQVLDARDPADFAGGHLRGGVNIGLGGKYATWAGTLLDPKRPIVLVAEPGRESEAAMRLGRIGFDQVAGYLENGMAALAARPDLLARVERVTAATLAEMLAGPEPPVVLDVRGAGERDAKRIEGSLSFPLPHLEERAAEVAAAVPKGRRLVVHCASGFRSSIAASLLARHGIAATDLVGGIAAWEAAGEPLISEGASCPG